MCLLPTRSYISSLRIFQEKKQNSHQLSALPEGSLCDLLWLGLDLTVCGPSQPDYRGKVNEAGYEFIPKVLCEKRNQMCLDNWAGQLANRISIQEDIASLKVYLETDVGSMEATCSFCCYIKM